VPWRNGLWFSAAVMADNSVAPRGAFLRYLFEIAAKPYGEQGVRFLERLVPAYDGAAPCDQTLLGVHKQKWDARLPFKAS
jgi:hypothetical protein